MKKMKMSIKTGVILTIAILMLAMVVYVISAQQVNTNDQNKQDSDSQTQGADQNLQENENIKVPDLVISGTVAHNELESGFYELDGYRLTGDYDFSEYEQKFTVATGDLDDSPSIYMVRTLVVRDIITRDDPEFKDKMERLINEYSTALEAAGEDKEKNELISNNLAMLQLILFKSNEDGNSNIDVQNGIGQYIGQIDSNFIEIKISKGTETIARSFQLSEDIKANFGEYNLKTGDSIKFNYQEREGQNPIILEIVKSN